MKQTIKGPSGIRIELDASEIYPDDPGAGAPAMVYRGRESGTYWCAVDTGELGDELLPQGALNWLHNQFDAVDAFMNKYSN